MKSAKYHKGLKKLLEMEGEAGSAVVEKMKQISPDFTRYLLEFVFGEIYARPGLDIKTKEAVTLAGMVTLGAALQVKVHVKAALNLGFTEQEIIEMMLQLAPIVGFVRAMDGLIAAKQAFDESKASPQ
ncbi:MAG: carboxymuconolactone decarboxylase family protein [Elusimicrobia bacterium]|nr:carboxymuconolactone decarboxylase family protein [Elusimicrobiota bacterium]